MDYGAKGNINTGGGVGLGNQKFMCGHCVSDNLQRKRRNHQLGSIPTSVDRYDDHHDTSQFNSEFYHFNHIVEYLEYLNPCEQLFNRNSKPFALDAYVTIEHIDEIQ
ncbi:hypothetical protein E4T44_00457 [Aureobasidium sp. EXF-8845]|nr:hypothetical protein E4T44_00457 [Aureobasidium sp. EXF-8845]KAI4857964.1 hypothetical protein E4T45_00528 [Aureobasidium sp. EXF-8846]